MKFAKDAAFADEAGTRLRTRLGEYVESFTSDSGQVSAELFKKNGDLVAYVAFAEGVTGVNVTDSYFTALHDRAKELGFENKFRIVYTGI